MLGESVSGIVQSCPFLYAAPSKHVGNGGFKMCCASNIQFDTFLHIGADNMDFVLGT